MSNKQIGIVKEVDEDMYNIILQTRGDSKGKRWIALRNATKQIKQSLKGCEIVLSIVNAEKRTFSYLKVLNGKNVQ